MKNRRGNEGIGGGLVGLGLALAACGGEPLTDDLGETASATDPWGWCVDHPCPNIEAVGYGGCPFDDGLLLVGVKNVGNLTSIPTRTYVEFRRGTSKLVIGFHDLGTDALSPGETNAYWVTVPPIWNNGCTTQLCRWKVIADATDLVNEVDGTNNVRSGTCWFPN